jgi:nicotinate-nucleotide adenylyltransferase
MQEKGRSPSAAPHAASTGRSRAASLGGKRVAFFGGSFDPPHRGHLAVARAARKALRLDTVLFAPVGAQPLKGEGAAASYRDRLAMTRLAIAGERGFALSQADKPAATGAPNYSLETLARLRAKLGQGAQLFFLMGADAFLGLRQWHGAAEIPFRAALIVASRPGQPLKNLQAALPEGLTMEAWPERAAVRGGVEVRRFQVRNRAGESAELFLLPGLNERASASAIRERLGRAKSEAALRAWLPDAVAQYVRAHRLYR